MLRSATLRRSFQAWVSFSDESAGPRWLRWVWTALACIACAVVFTVVNFAIFAKGEGAWRNGPGWWHWFKLNLCIAVCVGFSIQALFDLVVLALTRERVRTLSGVPRWLFFTVTPAAGVCIGWPLAAMTLRQSWTGWFASEQANVWFGMMLVSLIVTLALHQFFALKNRQLRAERQASDAQLRLLQGQMEPHFLFNTLATVHSLMDHDTPRAKRMLESFVDYLRASVGSLGQEARTLGDEIELVEAYLRIVQIRMDDRLRYTVDVPTELRSQPLPALILQPLVENAVQHGLEPKLDGGSVHIVARQVGSTLELRVDDDGEGLPAPGAVRPLHRPRTGGTGTALGNIRERLASVYGDVASLTIEGVTGRRTGVSATVRVPLAATTLSTQAIHRHA